MRVSQLFTKFIAVAAIALGALSAHAIEPRAGVEYDYMPTALPTDTPGKIEVIEFFWFGCPHCYKAEPAVEAWAKTLPKDVVFRREHVMWEGRSDMEGHVRIFLALKSMGLLDSMTQKVFDAIQRDHIELRREDVLFDWIAKQGIDRAKFEANYKSAFSVNAGIARATQLAGTYHIDGVPMFIVNGKYKTSPTSVQRGSSTPMDEVKGSQVTLDVVNALIAKERAAAKK
ncbi:MAG: thiol:disulfide interchange protein DsbA/DsbL [Burkholderiales bacterium]|nr:thiol:disulfide interchange protein DsbA/DsbL [Burkholderiales bacterium]